MFVAPRSGKYVVKWMLRAAFVEMLNDLIDCGITILSGG
jgi:hypothetical protein